MHACCLVYLFGHKAVKVERVHQSLHYLEMDWCSCCHREWLWPRAASELCFPFSAANYITGAPCPCRAEHTVGKKRHPPFFCCQLKLVLAAVRFVRACAPHFLPTCKILCVRPKCCPFSSLAFQVTHWVTSLWGKSLGQSSQLGSWGKRDGIIC